MKYTRSQLLDAMIKSNNTFAIVEGDTKQVIAFANLGNLELRIKDLYKAVGGTSKIDTKRKEEVLRGDYGFNIYRADELPDMTYKA